MSNTEASEKIMERVARLLALAEHPNTPAPEAELALRQANSLITKHAIDEAILRQSQTASERRAIEKRTIVIGGGWTFRPYLRTIIIAAADALRVVIVTDTAGQAHLYGAAEDISWLDMLFAMIKVQFLSKLDPAWDNSKSYDENVYTMKVAGFKWKEINALAVQNGHESRESHSHVAHITNDEQRDFWERHVQFGTGRFIKGDEVRDYNGFYHKLKAAYVRHAKSIGDDSRVVTQSHQAYRLSFAESFKLTMQQRFWQMKRDAESEMDTIPGAALALRDVRQDAKKAMWGDFPELSPEEIEKRRKAARDQAEAEAKARQDMLDAMTPKQREAFLEKEEREARRNEEAWRRRDERNSYSWDEGARARGKQAANSVDLTRKAGSAGAGSTRGELG
ncbi:hypothetical protein SEA_SPARCETUS_67 [Microbacterium phage Sparcetus]|nr:hypothetical protein SEA_SPARCETUS_67 [Microbacterium phage Sparcetus]